MLKIHVGEDALSDRTNGRENRIHETVEPAYRVILVDFNRFTNRPHRWIIIRYWFLPAARTALFDFVDCHAGTLLLLLSISRKQRIMIRVLSILFHRICRSR